MRAFSLCVATVLAAACAPASPGGSRPVAVPSDARQARVEMTGGDINFVVKGEVTTATADFAAPADRAWAVLPLAYQALGIPVRHNDPANRTLGNLQLSARRTLGGQPMANLFRCAGGGLVGPMENSYTMRISLRSQVIPNGSGSRVETTAQATARPTDGTSSGANSVIGCTSTGRLEQAIASQVQARLAASAGAAARE